MSELSDWAAAARVAMQNACHMATDAVSLMESNTDYPALKAKIEALDTVLDAIGEPPAEA